MVSHIEAVHISIGETCLLIISLSVDNIRLVDRPMCQKYCPSPFFILGNYYLTTTLGHSAYGIIQKEKLQRTINHNEYLQKLKSNIVIPTSRYLREWSRFFWFYKYLNKSL